MNSTLNGLKLVQLGSDTQQEMVVFIHANCFIYRSEGFESLTPIVVSLNSHSIVAMLNVVHSDIMDSCEVSLSEGALKKFMAICEAQGGFQEPPTASLTHDICALEGGIVTEIDNRSLAKVAKLAGAPHDPAAGIEFFAKIGTPIEQGQVLYRIHSESKGALNYACAYAKSMPDIVKFRRDK